MFKVNALVLVFVGFRLGAGGVRWDQDRIPHAETSQPRLQRLCSAVRRFLYLDLTQWVDT